MRGTASSHNTIERSLLLPIFHYHCVPASPWSLLLSLYVYIVILSLPHPPCHSLSKSLTEAQEKILALEEQLDQLLRKKNSTILDLESRVHRLERELQLACERLEQMRRTLEAIGHARESSEGDDGLDREMSELHECLDSLSRQLRSALEENERLHSR